MMILLILIIVIDDSIGYWYFGTGIIIQHSSSSDEISSSSIVINYTRFNIAQKEEGVGSTKLYKKLLYYFVVKNIYTQQYGRKATSSSS
jgi:hypothetical protein